MPAALNPPISVCLALTRAVTRSRTVDDIYDAALDALAQGVGVSRSAILLVDADGVMRLKAWRGLSPAYRATVEVTPWTPESADPQPLVLADVAREPSLQPFLPVIEAEGIAAMAFIPLVSEGRVIGRFMLYYPQPQELSKDTLQLVGVIAALIAFALERTQTQERARASERLKDEFLATLSHELRTPLNAILGWAQLLQAIELPVARLRHAIEIIGRNARLQAQLIDDILDVSQFITGTLDIERVPILIPELLHTALRDVMPAAAAKHIAVTHAIDADLPLVEGDSGRLQQVLDNVLSNAIKFTPDGGNIHVACRSEDNTIVIQVHDSGIGIPKEFLPLVFERFRQADSRATRRHNGLGLGLAIARHLVEHHHGQIEAHSDGPGRGTTVVIRLPGAPVRDSRLPVAASARARPFVRLEGTTVLVVDDHQDSRELLAALFRTYGASVVESESSAAAIAALDGIPVDLLVADIAMPDVDGCELIDRFRRGRPSFPAIAVSAYARQQDRNRAMEAGFSAYCTKPLHASEFLRTVQSVLLTAAAGHPS